MCLRVKNDSMIEHTTMLAVTLNQLRKDNKLKISWLPKESTQIDFHTTIVGDRFNR